MSYTLVPTQEYLSGDVVESLETAIRAASTTTQVDYEPNIQMLEAVMPEQMPISAIDIPFSACWMPPELIEDFVRDVLRVSCSPRYVKQTGTWDLRVGSNKDVYNNRNVYGIEWSDADGTAILRGTDLLEQAMNLKSPVIRVRPQKNGPTEVNSLLTTQAIEKTNQLHRAFIDWIIADPIRVEQVEQSYNKTFNRYVIPSFDGSYLEFPGMAETWRRQMRGYQRDAVAQGIQRSLGLFHEVGAGKTATGIAVVMERRRLGLSRKPVIIVKKSTLKQFGEAMRSMYPYGNFLVASKNDCGDPHKRQLFAARAMAGDYDAVVLTHTMFEFFALSAEGQVAYLQKQLCQVLDALSYVDPDGSIREQKRGKPPSVKNLVRMENRLRAKIEALGNQKDDGLTFEQIGFDFILADEADVYLNAPFHTKMTGVLGLSSSPSDLAIDFFMKVEYLRRQAGDHCIMVMTGTFLRNSMVQIYTWMQLLQPQVLEDIGVHCLDAWISLFAKVTTRLEIKPTGEYGNSTRLSEFYNLTELQKLFRQNCNILLIDQIKDGSIQRPEGRWINVVCPMSDTQMDWMKDIARRASLIRKGQPQTFIKSITLPDGEIECRSVEDNLLRVSTHGRLASLDMRCIDPEYGEDPSGKCRQLAKRIYKIWKRYAPWKAAQLVFCNISTPPTKNSDKWSFYVRCRELLIQMGIPANEIAFVQDCSSDEAKEALFAAVNAGEIRIVWGSTEKMGVGVNMQERAIAAHFVDCPWRPCDLIQMIGRIVRSGNIFKKVWLYRYVTQGVGSNTGFDSFMWQCVEAKWRSLMQFLMCDLSVRRIEDDASENPAFTAGEIKALATGDGRIMRHILLLQEIERLNQLRFSIDRELREIRSPYGTNSRAYHLHRINQCEDALKERARDYDTVRANLEKCTGGNFRCTLASVKVKRTYEEYTDPKKAIANLRAILNLIRDNAKAAMNKRQTIGHIGELTLIAVLPESRYNPGQPGEIEMTLRGPSGNEYSISVYANRFPDSYELILEDERDLKRKVAEHRQALALLETAEQQKIKRLQEVDDELIPLLTEKAELDEALGLNESKPSL